MDKVSDAVLNEMLEFDCSCGRGDARCPEAGCPRDERKMGETGSLPLAAINPGVGETQQSAASCQGGAVSSSSPASPDIEGLKPFAWIVTDYTGCEHFVRDEAQKNKLLASLSNSTVEPIFGADAIRTLAAERDALTYKSTQETTCAKCGKRKHTPLRRDEMGGYVCLTCIDAALASLAQMAGEPHIDKAALVFANHADNFMHRNKMPVAPATADWSDYSPVEQASARLAVRAILAAALQNEGSE